MSTTTELNRAGGRRQANPPVHATGLPPPSVREMGLEQLLESALLDRDEGAFAEVVRRMRPSMMRLALRHVASPEDADDVIQDTWIAALRGVHRFERRALLSTWILRILSYRARTHGKRASRSVPFSRAPLRPGAIDRAEPLFAPRATAPDEAVDARQMEELVASALVDLAPRQKQVFSLRAMSGLSADEVCQRLGISAGNERLLLHRARTQIRNRLAAYVGRMRRTPARDAEADGSFGVWAFVAAYA